MRWEEQLHKVFDKIPYTRGPISIKYLYGLKITGIEGDNDIVTYTVELHFVPKDMKLHTDFSGDYSEQLEAWYDYADDFMESKELTDRLQNQIMQRVNKVYGRRRNGFSISPVDNYYQIESGGPNRGPLLFSKQYKGHLKIETKDTSWTKVSLYEDNKMSEKTLRSKVIRLAHQKPELRKHLLPLVEKTSGLYYDPDPEVRSRDEARELARAFASDLSKVLGVEVDAQYNDDDNAGYEFLCQAYLFPKDETREYHTPSGRSYKGYEVTKERKALNRKVKRAVKVVAKKHKAIVMGRDAVDNPKVMGYKDSWGSYHSFYNKSVAEIWFSIWRYPHNDGR